VNASRFAANRGTDAVSTAIHGGAAAVNINICGLSVSMFLLSEQQY